jgi:hypothetical protein
MKEMELVHIPKFLSLKNNFKWGGKNKEIEMKKKQVIKSLKNIDDLEKIQKIELFIKDLNVEIKNEVAESIDTPEKEYNGRAERKKNPLNDLDNLGLKTGECAYHVKEGNSCIENLINKISDKLKTEKVIEPGTKDDDIMNKLKDSFNCSGNGKKKGDKCVAEKLRDMNYITEDISLYFKPNGPIDNKLFSNVNIDNVLDHFEILFPNYYHINFLMNDWQKAPANHEIHNLLDNNACKLHKKTLETEKEEELNKTKEEGGEITERIMEIISNSPKTCFGCVLNTDMYSGPGIHWVSLFIDLRDKKNPTIEYFNSSGNLPLKNFRILMEELKDKFEKCVSENIKLVNVTKEEQQQSDNNCGSWAVFYQYNRLKGIPYKYFNGVDYESIEDKVIDNFRKYIFYTTS